MVTRTAAAVYRDFETTGVPASGAHEPLKSDIRALLLDYETQMASTIATTALVFDTRASLNAKLGYVANSRAEVRGDSTAAYNGIYAKVGASGVGSWTRISDLADELITLTVISGTNDLIVSASPQLPAKKSGKLYQLAPLSNNTGAVTITDDAGNVAPLKSILGNALAADDVLADTPNLLIWNEAQSEFRLLLTTPTEADGVLAAAVAAQVAAEAARDIAISAAGESLLTFVNRDTALQGATLPSGITTVRVLGRAVANDCIPFTMVRVNSQPSHPGKIRSGDRYLGDGTTTNSTNGGWWEVSREGWAPTLGFGTDGAALKGAVEAGYKLVWVNESYTLTDKCSGVDGQMIMLAGPGIVITQTTAETPIFQADNKDNFWVVLNGGRLIGEGGYSDAWGGTGHLDRGVDCINCTRSGVLGPGNLRNFAAAGICLEGGNGYTIGPGIKIEGTNDYGVPILLGDNIQSGVMILDHTTYGATDNVIVHAIEICGTALGFLTECYPAVDTSQRLIVFLAPNIHNLNGQHAGYNQGGGINVINPTFRNIALDAFKTQSSADNNADIRNVVCTGVNARDIGGNLFTVPVLGDGSVASIMFSGVGKNVADGINTKGKVLDLHCVMELENCSNSPVEIQDHVDPDTSEVLSNAPADIEIHFKVRTCGKEAANVTATQTGKIKLYPTVRDPLGTSAASEPAAILVQSVSADVDIYDPDVIDSQSPKKMYHWLFNSTPGSVVTVNGMARALGSQSNPVRADAVVQWNVTKYEYDTAGATIKAFNSMDKVYADRIALKLTTASGTNAALWSREIADNTTLRVVIEYIGTLSDGSQSRGCTFIATFMRHGAGAVLVGSSTAYDHVTGGFGAIPTFTVSDNAAVFQVNSGGAATYAHEYEARVLGGL